MDDRDVYEISFNLGPAEKEIDALLAKLSSLESRIIKTFQIIETVTVGSVNKATAELGRLSGAIEKSLDDIQKKAGSRKKPIVIVEQKDVQQAKKNLADMGDAVTELAKKVDDQATEIAGDIQRAFQSPPTLVTDTQVFPTTATEINPATRVSPTQAGYPGTVYRSDLNTQALPVSEAAAPVPIAPALAQNEAALKEEAKQAAIAERALIRLLAAELRVAAGADQVTKEYIDAAAATAKNADAYIDQVNAIAKVGTAQERLTRDQVEYAQTIARTKNEINNLNKQLQEQATAYNNAKNRLQENIAVQQGVQGAGGKPMADAGAATKESLEAFEAEKDIRDELIEKIDAQVAKLRFLNDEREKGAADAQRQAEIEKLAEEAKAAIGQDAAAGRVARLRQERAAQALLNKQREQAAAQFVRIAKSMGAESTAMNALGQKYGIFSVNLKRTADASNAVEKEFHDIIRASPKLSAVFDQLIDQVGEFQVNTDPSTFRVGGTGVLDPNEVRQLGFAFQGLGVTGAAAFGEIYAAIGAAGLAIGLVTATGVTLIETLVAIGEAGVQAFKDILAASIELASKRQTLGEGFEAYLQDAEAAKAALEEVDRISRDLGVDVSPIAQSFLPSVRSIEELELLARLGQSLALSEPGKQIEDATVAIREFLAGDITSLRKQFEVPGYVLDEAKKISETTGSAIEGLRHISEFLERTGRSAEALSDTFAVSRTRAQEFLNTFGRDFGEDIVASLESSLNDLLAMVTDKESLIRNFAGGVGNVVGDVLTSAAQLATRLLESIDFGALEDVLARVQRVGEAISIALDAVGAGGSLTPLTLTLEILSQIADEIERITIGISGLITLSVAWTQGVQAIFGYLAVAYNHAATLVDPDNYDNLQASIADMDRLTTESEQTLARLRELSDLFNQVGQDVGEFNGRLNETDTSNLDDILASQYQGGDDSVNELKEAVEKYLKEIADLRQDIINKNLDLAVKLSDSLLDFLEDNARKRLEIARKNRDDLIDLEEEYERKVRDANQDLADSLEDVDIEAGRQRLRQAREFADKRVEIEEDYQRKVAEIRRKYAFDLQEAARQNDAVAYLRLLRQREFDLNEARIDRDEALGDVDTDEGKKNDEAAQKRREDEEDARRSNKRKLRDLQTWLDDQEAEIKKNYKRELEAQTIQEEEKRKDIIKNYQRDLRDLRLHYEQRLEELQKGLAEEYDMVGQWQQRMLDQQREFVTQWFGITNQTIGKNTPGGAGGRGLGDEPVQPGGMGGGRRPWNDGGSSGGDPQAQHSRQWYEDEVRRLAQQLGQTNIIPFITLMSLAQLIRAYQNLVLRAGGPSRDSGGHVQANQSVIVGRNGMPEVFTPGSSGYITPISQLYRQPLPAAAQSYAYDQRKMNVDLSLLDTAMLDRSIAELVKLRIREVMEEAFV